MNAGALSAELVGFGPHQSVEALNQLLVDTMSCETCTRSTTGRVSGPTFYSLHLLFDKHFEEQRSWGQDRERVQSLGGGGHRDGPRRRGR